MSGYIASERTHEEQKTSMYSTSDAILITFPCWKEGKVSFFVGESLRLSTLRKNRGGDACSTIIVVFEGNWTNNDIRVARCRVLGVGKKLCWG